jgi:hypothetical protein
MARSDTDTMARERIGKTSGFGHGPCHDCDAPRSRSMTRHATHIIPNFLLSVAKLLPSSIPRSLPLSTTKMVTPAKRVLAETTNTRQNIPSSQTPAAKKIRLNGHGRANGDENRSFSSQPKSQFEEHLEKLSSSINGLKELNAERDQQWARPTLHNFNPATDSLCFQQIDAEEGTVSGGKQTVRLFGVTEV